MNAKKTLRLNPEDNIVVAIADLPAGSAVEGEIVTRARVPRGHKTASRFIATGEPIRKFGQVIGFASTDIEPGDWVHEKNVTMGEDFDRDYAFASEARPPEGPRADETPAFFEGYKRADGRAGTRNYIGILSSVNCSATVVDYVADEINRSGILADYPGIDGIVPLPHGQGCGMAGRGEAFDVLSRTQWGYASHPNFAAVLLVGLGCEVFQIPRMKDTYGIAEGDHVAQAFAAIRKAGTVVLTAMANIDSNEIPINLFELAMFQKRIQGALFGMMSPSAAIPYFLNLYSSGNLLLDELATRRYSLEEINVGYADMHAGTNIRGVVDF